MPTYLIAERGINLKAVGYLTPIPFIASFLSTAVCGWVINKYFDKQYISTALYLVFTLNTWAVSLVLMPYLALPSHILTLCFAARRLFVA